MLRGEIPRVKCLLRVWQLAQLARRPDKVTRLPRREAALVSQPAGGGGPREVVRPIRCVEQRKSVEKYGVESVDLTLQYQDLIGETRFAEPGRRLVTELGHGRNQRPKFGRLRLGARLQAGRGMDVERHTGS